MLVKLSNDVTFFRTRVHGKAVELQPGQLTDLPAYFALPLVADGRLVKGSYPDICNDAVVAVDLRSLPTDVLPQQYPEEVIVKPRRGRPRK